MKDESMKTKITLILMMFSLIVIGIGCSENSVNDTSGATTNLSDEFGGYTSNPESPGFGDSDLTATADEEEEYDDAILLNPAVDSLVKDELAGKYHFRAVWGMLRYDSSVTNITDWTGSLTVSNGGEAIRRVIRFEYGQDYIVPRTEREKIEWVSKTTTHNDGLAIDLYIPRPDFEIDSTLVENLDSLGNVIDTTYYIDTVWEDLSNTTLTFETALFTMTFTLAELTALDTVFYLDDSNAVAIHALRLNQPCARGFMSGTWGYDTTGQGVFGGLWENQHGMVVGYYKGHFGTDDSGQRLFYGKWISLNGEFEGFLKGTWDSHPHTNANDIAHRRAGGWYGGHIYSENGALLGSLKGKYKSHPHHKSGFMQGRWKIHCNEPDTITSFEEGF